jgi:B-box zinc finger/IQ calmodulin-binding motif
MSESLDAATVDFLNEVSSARCLHLSENSVRLTVREFVEYLGIDMSLEPHLIWVAREMVCAPMPPRVEQIFSKTGIVFFRDTDNDLCTLEHPLTQRYLKVLERQRLDTISIRFDKSAASLLETQSHVLMKGDVRMLQIPCEDCGMFQSTTRCNQCLISFCESCYENLHTHATGPRKDHTSYHTAHGSTCSSCSVKKPQSFCLTCEDYFCYACYEVMHKKGLRTDHKAMLVSSADSEIIDTRIKCEECQDQYACVRCDYCLENFCVTCFWKLHLNGNRRFHTASKSAVNPVCSRCVTIRATVFCEQCQELYCTECFTSFHHKGGRQLHLFIDATNLLLLLERMEPAFANDMEKSRTLVLTALSKIQACYRGMTTRRALKQQHDVLVRIQKRWRGNNARTKLMAVLNQFKWRKKQFDEYYQHKEPISS